MPVVLVAGEGGASGALAAYFESWEKEGLRGDSTAMLEEEYEKLEIRKQMAKICKHPRAKALLRPCTCSDASAVDQASLRAISPLMIEGRTRSSFTSSK